MPRSPAAWLSHLEPRLDARWSEWDQYDKYYEGDHRLAFASRTYVNRFGKLLAHLVSNWMPLIVDSTAERIRVQGLRFGDEADTDIWAIWQANGLDAQANMVHTESIKLGEAYWLVQPNGEDGPKITAEHPRQVIVATAPGDRRTRLAALKKWLEDDGHVRANIYLPDRVAKFRSQEPVRSGDMQRINWGTASITANPLGVVPIVPMPNNPSMLQGGVSDLARGKLAIQDAINKMLGDSQVGSETHAMPQRVMLGVEPPRDPITGRVIADKKMMESQLWYFNVKEGASATEFSAADLSQLRELVDGQIGDLASQTRTPAHYFKPQSVSNISAETLQGFETGLVSKVRDKMDAFGDGYEEVARLAFRAIDPQDPRATETNIEVIWRDPESRSMAQVIDAATKKMAIGVPWEQIMEDIGYSPPQIDRMAAMREQDQLLGLTLQPPAQPETPAQPPATDAGVTP